MAAVLLCNKCGAIIWVVLRKGLINFIMNSNSQCSLLRVTQNDSSLAELRLEYKNNYYGDDGTFYSDNSDDYSTLGAAIANNTHLKTLAVTLTNELPLGMANRGFYHGLQRNSSISNLELHCNYSRNIAGGVAHEILKIYQENNSQLTVIRIDDARVQNGGDRAIMDTLRTCRNLQNVTLYNCNITDEQLLPIVDAIRGHLQLEELRLYGNNIGNAGCEALAALLSDPNSNLRMLSLAHNAIHNEGATTIANSLSNNNKLQKLYLKNNPINQSVEDNFSNILCNTSNINSLYASNHTLGSLYLPLEFVHGQNLKSLLSLNRKGHNGSHAAIKKILKFHPNIDMEPLFEWGMEEEGERNLKALPYVVDWFEKAKIAVAEEDETHHIAEKKLSAIFQFAKAMPLLLEGIARYDTHVSGGSGNKRKRTEE